MKEPRILTISERKLIGVRIRTSLAANQTTELWQKFMSRHKEISNRIKHKFYSVQNFDDPLKLDQFTKDTVFEKWAAVEVPDLNYIPEGMESHTLSEGKYAVFIHSGPVSEFYKTTQYIFGTWLPYSDYELDAREHFEIMDEKYIGPADPGSEEEVWIPIRDKNLYG